MPPRVAGPETPPADDQSETDGKNAEDNDRHRRLATAYFESNPLGDAMLVRQGYEPFRRYMASKMKIAGVGYKRKQHAIEGRYLAARLAGPTDRQRRSFQVLECATLRLENQFLKEVDLLMMHEELWMQTVPAACLTLKRTAAAFSLMYGAGCAVECVLVDR